MFCLQSTHCVEIKGLLENRDAAYSLALTFNLAHFGELVREFDVFAAKVGVLCLKCRDLRFQLRFDFRTQIAQFVVLFRDSLYTREVCAKREFLRRVLHP